jgi:glycosyltransferase involved in cell wall biosynthesis
MIVNGDKQTSGELRILFLTNKALPDSDHRLAYGHSSDICSITFALPDKPHSLDPAEFVRVGIGEGLRLRYLWRLIFLVARVAGRRKQFDLVHHASGLPFLLGPALFGLIGMPSVITITGFGRLFTSETPIYRSLRPLFMQLLGLSVRLARRVLFQNHGDLARLAKKYPAYAHKFCYAGSAVQMPVTKDKDFSSPNLRVLFPTRLMPDKGVDDFLQAAKMLHGQGFEFVLAGPGSLGFDGLFEKVKEHDAAGIIRYLGELTSSATVDEFAKAHVIYFPSYGEGMARVMLEAGFGQLCPICYDIPANRDLIAEGRGFLVSRGDIDAAVSVLRTLAADRQATRSNAVNYQKHILENYTMEIFTRRMDEIFKDLSEELGLKVKTTPIRLPSLGASDNSARR